MNAAMQTMLGIVSGKAVEGKGGDNRRGEQLNDPFALLLEKGQTRSHAHRSYGGDASATELAQAFFLAQPEFELEEAGGLQKAFADLLNDTDELASALQVNSEDAAPDSSKDFEGEQTSVEAALMQALAALLDNGEAEPGEHTDGMDDESLAQQEADEPEMPAEIPPMPYPHQSQTGDGLADRRANIDPGVPHASAPVHAQARAAEASRDTPGRLQQPVTLQEITGARMEEALRLSPRAVQAEVDRLAGTRPLADAPAFERVQILSQQSSATPLPIAHLPLSLTGQSVVHAIETANPMRPVQADMANMISQRIIHSGTTSLKIQLQPANLGVVTARLIASGTQLSVELQVETSDARQRLSGESEAIMKAMRAIGYDVERVTVQQSAPAPNQQAAGQQNAAAREFAGGQQQAESDDNGRGGRQGHAQGNAQGQNGNEPAQNHTDGSVYI